MPRFLCVTLPYRPPSPGKEPKAEDEKAPRVYSSVAEAERERGLVSEVCGTLEWADQFHFPRSTEPPVKRGLFRRVPNAHDENAPRPGGRARVGGGVLSRGKPKPTRRTTTRKKTLFVDLSRVDDETPVTIDCSSSESEVDFLDKVDETSARSESEESESEEAYGDEPVWGKDEDATWHPALEGTKPNLKRKKSGTKKKSTARTKRRVIKKTISSSPPMKYACDADRILFRRGAARALGSRMARAELFGDADDDSTTDDDDDDDDEASVPPPANGDESSSSEKIQPTLENEPETDDDDDDDDDDATREVESSPAAPVLLGGEPKDQPREGGVDERARRLASTA
jgi:hypothetical protein